MGDPRDRAWAEIDLAAVRHNTRLLRELVAPAELCAVVKADGYGHGAPAVARAALEAGATWLAVATVDEGVELRDQGVDAPVLVLSEPRPHAMADLVAAALTATLYSPEGVAALDAAARAVGVVADAHVKVDTGMHRVGADMGRLAELAAAVAGAEGLRFAALWSHLAVSESAEPDDRAFTAEQLRRFDAARGELASAGLAAPLHHLANSGGALAHPGSRRDMVRCGIALYGEAPSAWAAEELARAAGGGALRPVLSLRARASLVRVLAAGERPSYGRRRPLPEASTVVTVPLGYADGVPRRYFDAGGTVLVGGRHCPLAGAVTMDQIVVDCGPGAEVSVGDEIVLIGSQGGGTVTATSWADALGTISYEVLCGIGPRVPRVVVDSGDRDPEPGQAEEAGT